MQSGRFYEFGPFRFDAAGRVLLREGQAVAIPPKVADTLLLLVENAGKVVDKEELLKKVWPDAFIEEGSLTRTISILRKTLGESNEGQEYIATISKRGYRFVAPVTEVAKDRTPAKAEKVMLAVLPFENFSEDKRQEYLSDGLTEEMITELGRVNPQRLGVIARTSAMTYKSTPKSVQEIGSELGVSYVLEGSVRRAGNRIRIAAQLIQAEDQTHVWAQSYERDVGDILILQREVAQAIARQIQIKLGPQEQKRWESAGPIKPQAHEAYLKGRYFWYKRTEEAMRKSIECFEQAIEHEPRYAAAYDGVSDAYVMLACRGVVSATEAFHKAKTAARKALEIDGSLGEAYASLAHVRLHDWDWVGLEEDFTHALELNPGHAIAHYWYAEYLMAMGRAEESIARARQAHQMDPVNPVLSASVGMILYLARKFEHSTDGLLKALEIDPNHFLLHFRLALNYLQMGMQERAIAEMQSAVALSHRSTEALTGLAQTYAAAGMRKAMREVVKELDQESRVRYVSPYNMARVYGSAGDKGQAFIWLERAYDEHNPDLIELKMEPSFDSVRSDPRFNQLLQRIGFV